jgi:hypothetical protein
MNTKILSLLVFSIFLFSSVSAMTVYGDFQDGSQSATVNVGQSISFNTDFFSMNPPITSMKAQLYQGNNLISTFLNSNTNSKTYSNTYNTGILPKGTYTIQIIGTDKTNTDSETLSLTVTPVVIPPTNSAPVITSSPVIGINEGNFYTYPVSATDADGDTLVYSLIQGSNWLSINQGTGLISGTAPLVNSNTNYDIIVGVSDGVNPIVSQDYILTVFNTQNPPTNSAPVITSNPVRSVTEKLEYDYQVIADDSDGDTLTYSLLSAPSWLSINSANGFVFGVAPSVNENTQYNVIVQVSDGTYTDTQSYTLTVRDVSTINANIRYVGNDIYDQNKYFDQFSTKTVYGSLPEPKTQSNLFEILIYILVGLILIGIIVAAFFLGNNLRNR